MKTNYSPQVNRKRLIPLLSYRVILMQKEFYKVLGKAFQDFNRTYENRTETNRKTNPFLLETIKLILKYNGI